MQVCFIPSLRHNAGQHRRCGARPCETKLSAVDYAQSQASSDAARDAANHFAITTVHAIGSCAEDLPRYCWQWLPYAQPQHSSLVPRPSGYRLSQLHSYRAVAERAKAEQLGFPEAVSAFRQLCEQQITQQFRSNLAAAQAMSTVLDLGNTIAASLSGPAPASSAPQSYLHRQLEAAAQFWRASDPATDLLGLPKAPQAAAKAAGSKRLPGAQLAAAGKRPKLQGKKAQKGASELSPSVQLVLAQLLDLLTADQQTSNVVRLQL